MVAAKGDKRERPMKKKKKKQAVRVVDEQPEDAEQVMDEWAAGARWLMHCLQLTKSWATTGGGSATTAVTTATTAGGSVATAVTTATTAGASIATAATSATTGADASVTTAVMAATTAGASATTGATSAATSTASAASTIQLLCCVVSSSDECRWRVPCLASSGAGQQAA